MDEPLTQPGPQYTSAQGAQKAAGDLAYHTFGRNPKATGVVVIALVVVLLLFIILFIVYLNKYKDCDRASKNKFNGTTPYGNLNTGSNSPLWQFGSYSAGEGGPMDSNYQHGESRVYAASAEGPNSLDVVPVLRRDCKSSGVSPMAAGEAQALMAAQAYNPSDSAKSMDDDALMRVMNGGT